MPDTPDPTLKPTPGLPPRLLLASASPRRRELIALLGLPFEVRTSPYQEPAPPAETVVLSDFVETLAFHKAQAVAEQAEAGRLVLGADTIVTLETGDSGLVLGKPTDHEDARRMLRLLSGRTHHVLTGVALIRALGNGATEAPLRATVRTGVTFRPLNGEMIEGYLATGEPFDKAGAYGAQGYAAPFICGIEGDFFNVVGLPLSEVGRLLERAGVDWWRFRAQTPSLPD